MVDMGLPTWPDEILLGLSEGNVELWFSYNGLCVMKGGGEMSKRVSESIYSDGSLVVPLADVQHIEKRRTAGSDKDFLMIIMKSTRYNTKIDDWDNPVYVPAVKAQAFLSAWCFYRHELEYDTLADVAGAAVVATECNALQTENKNQAARIAELEAESKRKGKETEQAIDVGFSLINGFAEAETCIAELEGQLKIARAADAIAKSNVLDVQQECIKANKRITELEADIKLLEAGVVTVDGEREVLYGRIDELLQAMKGGE